MPEARTLLDNRYAVLHIERTSNFSKVFFALDTYQNPPRSCVIKVLKPIAQKPKIAQWRQQEFQKEANRLKQLSLHNQHLPQIYTYSSDSSEYYLVRELIEGATLQAKVKHQGKLSDQEVAEILVKLLRVLKYLHENDVIHQNIKPKNIILRDDDNLPMLINFGSIKQIVVTFDFSGNKQIFSTNNIYGYIPSEQALGQPVPASDLYSLGLTAVYLLTGKNPLDLQIDPDYGNLKMPLEIVRTNPKLAEILARAISLNSSDRYGSAQEMLDALRGKKPQLSLGKKENLSLNSNKLFKKYASPVVLNGNNTISPPSNEATSDLNWWKITIYIISGLYIMGAGTIALLDWNLNQTTVVPQLPEPSISLPSDVPASPQVNSISKQFSMLNSQSKDLVEIPILATGTPKKQIRKILGEPNAIQKGYWENSSAWIYKGKGNGLIDMGYLFDLDTNKLRQTEVAIAPSVGLGTIEEILGSLLEGNITPSLRQELEKIYQRQEYQYSFSLKDLEGSIERDKDDNIYLGVWQADFH